MMGLVRKIVRNADFGEGGGYGFIRSDPRTEDFFFPLSQTIGEIHVYDWVEFWLTDNPSKPGTLMATEVTARAPRTRGEIAAGID
jgi:hypothetical protein